MLFLHFCKPLLQILQSLLFTFPAKNLIFTYGAKTYFYMPCKNLFLHTAQNLFFTYRAKLIFTCRAKTNFYIPCKTLQRNLRCNLFLRFCKIPFYLFCNSFFLHMFCISCENLLSSYWLLMLQKYTYPVNTKDIHILHSM